ncbi:site-specific recombinase, phage integrase (plasmid) [Erwinia billingiae Eb661]|uniref:Site-specific recombinase, phage integrase n=1 Tax=Erwinia billingiae (strain Eb661) TaxID=634500 RepID=D8MJN4_ERWBE|nr:site-specific recombinase, phage integrase [Erwinia billingiae Eb661]
MFKRALDSKLRGCNLVKLKVSDVAYGQSGYFDLQVSQLRKQPKNGF